MHTLTSKKTWKSIIGWAAFAVKSLLEAAALWIFLALATSLYTAVLFRPFGSLSENASENVLWALAAASLILITTFCCICFDTYRISDVLSASAVGLGIYTVAVYWPLAKGIIITAGAAGVGIAVIYTATKRRRRGRRMRFTRKGKTIQALYRIAAITFAAIMAVLSVNLIVFHTLIRPAVHTVSGSAVSEETISSHIETLSQLEETRWETLSAQKKLDVLQTLANIEQNHLHLPYELRVTVNNLSDDTDGGYIHSEHQIAVNADHLLNASGREAADTIFHEAYHSYEHNLVDICKKDRSQLSTQDLVNAMIYQHDFDHYVQGSENFAAYYNQSCEEDSRTYAASRVITCFDRIYDYRGIVMICR